MKSLFLQLAQNHISKANREQGQKENHSQTDACLSSRIEAIPAGHVARTNTSSGRTLCHLISGGPAFGVLEATLSDAVFVTAIIAITGALIAEGVAAGFAPAIVV